MGRLPSKATFLGGICACAVAIAGCGGGDDAASPLDNALGYLGEDAPLAVAVDTDLKGDQYEAIDKILARFPFGNALKQNVKRSLEQESGNFEDFEALLGNEFVVGTTSVGAIVGPGSGGDDFVAAIETKSADRLEELVKREKAEEVGEKNGATIYRAADGDSFAVKDAVLIVAGSRKQLEGALEQRESDDRLTEDTFEQGAEGLPDDALVRIYGDVQRILAADPSTKDARKVKWVRALRTLGATISFEGDEANVDFRLNTDPEQLTREDLPFAPGSDAPSLVDRAGLVAAGIRDPKQIVDFAERAGEAIDPGGFGDYETAKRAIEKRLGVDLENDLLRQLRGDLGITYSARGNFGVRAQLRNPDRFDRTLARLGRVLPDVAEQIVGEPVGYAKPKRGGDFYALATADGDSIVYGVIDDVFVLANDARTAGQLSKESTRAVSGAEGSVVVNANAEQLVRQLLPRFEGLGGLAGALVTGPLDQLTGSMSATEDGVAGSFRLTLD